MSSVVFVNTTDVTVEVLSATSITVDVTYSSTEVEISNLQGPQGPSGVVSVVDPITFDQLTAEIGINSTSDDVANYVVQRDANQRFSIGGIDFDTASTQTSAAARLYWDGNQSLNLGLGGGNVTIALGQEVINYVTNAEATTLNVGEVVYLFGAQGDRPSVKRASNLSDTTSSKTFGIVAESITAGGAGFVVNKGIVQKINTQAYNPGDVLWLGSTPGTFTTTKPVAPNHLVFVGVVLRTNAGNGLVYVSPQNGYELGEIHDVLLTSESDGQYLVYEASTDLWKNKSISATAPAVYNASTQVISVSDASTSAKGVVRLSSSTDSTSEVLAATPKAVKDAYDLASGAIPKSLIDAAGDLVVGSAADTAARLAIGTDSYVLTVDNTAPNKIAWKAATGGSTSVASPITNTGTSTNPIIGIDDASTSQKGAVQLSSSTDSTSEVLAATPKAVKEAYDLANVALPESIIDAAGDLIVGASADTAAILAKGSNTYVLTVDDTAPNKLAWKAPVGGSTTVTSPITNSGTSNDPIIGILSATTSQAGAVQLSSATNSTSEVLAATPKAVKDAYDLADTANTTANGAVPKSTVTTKGDLIVATASATVARQGVGNNYEFLIADSAQTNGIKWSNVIDGGSA